mgnify:CR=1 FL=1
MRKISTEELKVMAKKTLNSKELKTIQGGFPMPASATGKITLPTYLCS